MISEKEFKSLGWVKAKASEVDGYHKEGFKGILLYNGMQITIKEPATFEGVIVWDTLCKEFCFDKEGLKKILKKLLI